MATHFSILAWRIPWTEEPGGLQSKGSQRVRVSTRCKKEKNEARTPRAMREGGRKPKGVIVSFNLILLGGWGTEKR